MKNKYGKKLSYDDLVNDPICKNIPGCNDQTVDEIIQSKNETLLNQIKNSDVIVGCETYPMAIASIAGKDVFSSVPPGGKKISIPFKNIKYLRDLI